MTLLRILWLIIGAAVLLALNALVTLGIVRWCGVGQNTIFHRKVAMLFGTDGTEYTSPTYKMLQRLDAADDQERAELLEFLTDLIAGNGGFTQFVAADVLYAYFEDKANWQYMSERTAQEFGRQIIQLNNLGGTIPITAEELTKGLRDNLYQLFWPRCAMSVGAEWVTWKPGLPKGWKAEESTIEIDGQVASHLCPVPQGDMPLVMVNVPDFIKAPPPDKVEDHEIVVKVTLRAPNGVLVPLEQRSTFEVYHGMGPSVEWIREDDGTLRRK